MTTLAAVEKSGIAYSVYNKCRRQLSVGIKASLRNGKAPADKDRKCMEREIERLKAIVVSQAQAIVQI